MYKLRAKIAALAELRKRHAGDRYIAEKAWHNQAGWPTAINRAHRREE